MFSKVQANDFLSYSYWQNATVPTVKNAINNGAETEAQDEGGRTLLMGASMYNENPDIIITLIKADADATVKDSKGEIAYDYILENDVLKDSEACWILNYLRFKNFVKNTIKQRIKL